MKAKLKYRNSGSKTEDWGRSREATTSFWVNDFKTGKGRKLKIIILSASLIMAYFKKLGSIMSFLKHAKNGFI